MGEWIDAYIDMKDAEWDSPNHGLSYGKVEPKPHDYYEKKTGEFASDIEEWLHIYAPKNRRKFRGAIVYHTLYGCWRQCYKGNNLGYEKWLKTEEGVQYYWKVVRYLEDKGLVYGRVDG